MKSVTPQEFKESLDKQGVPREPLAFFCPACGTIQSATDLIKAGAGKDFEAVVGYLGFSCVGRFLKAGPPRKDKDGKPCNWTLGGLFRIHKYEVVTEDGERHPHFEPASAGEAVVHMADNVMGCKAV
jgi:hypothetical protein